MASNAFAHVLAQGPANTIIPNPPIATLSYTPGYQRLFDIIVPENGFLKEVRFQTYVSSRKVIQDPNNYFKFSLLNKGQDGLGNLEMLSSKANSYESQYYFGYVWGKNLIQIHPDAKRHIVKMNDKLVFGMTTVGTMPDPTSETFTISVSFG